MKRGSLSVFLNNNTSLEIQVVSEEFIVESIQSLFFHLSSVHYFKCDQGIFTVDRTLGTHDYTPKSLQYLLRQPLQAASYLYEIKSFITRVSTSSLNSVLQESMEQNVIVPFYKNIESVKAKTIMEFLFKTRPYFANLRDALEVVHSPDPTEKVFWFARKGSKEMMKIAAQILGLFAELCKNAITIHNSSALNSSGFFIKKSQNNIFVENLPSAVPAMFAEDIANAALSLIVIAPPMKMEDPLESMNVDLSQLLSQHQDFLSFDLLLPTEVPSAETPDEEIFNFRAAAWSMSSPKPKKLRTYETQYGSLDEAVRKIMLQPLWPQAKKVQLDLVEFMMKDQQLMQVLGMLESLFLMKRGDLHNSYICGDIPIQKAGNYFSKYLSSIPFFEYRFLVSGSIAVTVPHRLRRIITSEQLGVYQDCYQWMVRLQKLQYSLYMMTSNRTIISLRLKLMQFFLAMQQIAIWRLEKASFQLKQMMESAKTLNDLINAHKEFVDILRSVSMKPYENISRQINAMFEFCSNFTKNGCHMDEHQLEQNEQQFNAFRTFLHGLLAKPAKKDPEGIEASLLQAIC